MSHNPSSRTTHPLYVVLDVSATMWPAWGDQRARTRRTASAESFMSLVPNTVMALSESPAMRAAASVSVLAFSDEPQVLAPMRPLTDPPVIAEPAEGTQTNYAAILHFLLMRFHHDARGIAREHGAAGSTVTIGRPSVLFITDGAPFTGSTYQRPHHWMPARNRLTSPPIGARIVAIGPPGSCEPVLWRLATGEDHGDRNAFIADLDADPDGLAESIITSITGGAERSVPADTLIIPTSPGMRRVRRPAPGAAGQPPGRSSGTTNSGPRPIRPRPA